ncbi:hypothetical protein [Dyadobacter sp. NIV53]|uniref:hypothetical protein n=1 Tax=Dyadobacter sp. NIV53 TaxID=2861765 RepID=UPI001C87D49F|nr:hypothetical protein [Dyadobacter sp. NIV53]
MRKELWYFLINGQTDNITGLYGNFYAYGQHLGNALDNTFKVISKEGFNNPNLIEASKLDNFEVIENREELKKLSSKVHMRQKTHSFAFDDPDKEFQPPIGISKATGDEEYDYDLISENFVAFGQDENGFFEFELVVGKAKFVEVFLKTIEFLPLVDGFWIYIQNHWDNDKTELWVAKHFVEKGQIIDFLTKHEINTLKNGYIKVVVHCSQGETNLTLDDHKKIQLHTKDEDVFKQFIGQIVELGYEQTREFYNLEFGFLHWHYRLSDSLTRKEFIKMLQENEFELIDKWDE